MDEMNAESVQILSQSAGSPRLYQLSPKPSDQWCREFDRCTARASAAVRQSPPGVNIRTVARGDLEATGVGAEDSTEVDAAVRSLVKQANHRALLIAVNRAV